MWRSLRGRIHRELNDDSLNVTVWAVALLPANKSYRAAPGFWLNQSMHVGRCRVPTLNTGNANVCLCSICATNGTENPISHLIGCFWATGAQQEPKHIRGDFKQISMKKKKNCTKKNLDLIGCGQQWWLGRWKYDRDQQLWPHPIKSCTRIGIIKTALFEWQTPLASFWMFLNLFFLIANKKKKKMFDFLWLKCHNCALSE